MEFKFKFVIYSCALRIELVKWTSNLTSLNEHVEVITAAWFGTKTMVFTKKKYGRVWKKMKCGEEVETKSVKLNRVQSFFPQVMNPRN